MCKSGNRQIKKNTTTSCCCYEESERASAKRGEVRERKGRKDRYVWMGSKKGEALTCTITVKQMNAVNKHLIQCMFVAFVVVCGLL